MGPGTDEKAAAGDVALELHAVVILNEHHSFRTIHRIIELLEHRSVIVITPNHMRNQRNIATCVVQNILNQPDQVFHHDTGLRFLSDNQRTQIDAHSVSFFKAFR